jgi:hypothetical protein
LRYHRASIWSENNPEQIHATLVIAKSSRTFPQSPDKGEDWQAELCGSKAGTSQQYKHQPGNNKDKHQRFRSRCLTYRQKPHTPS